MATITAAGPIQLSDRPTGFFDLLARFLKDVAEDEGDRLLFSTGSADMSGQYNSMTKARAEYDKRRKRAKHFPQGLFGEPAWDMLLDLFVSCQNGTEISVTSACIAAYVPATTALRWLQNLELTGFVERFADAKDKRRYIVRLTEVGYSSMCSYFDS